MSFLCRGADMPLDRNVVGIKVYAPVLAGDESRLVAAVHGLERALPGLSLGWTVSDDHQLVPLPERDAWLVQARRNDRIPFVCNNDESYPITMSALEISARSGPGGQPLLDVHADLPLDATVIAAASEMLEAVAEGAHAFWGHATPFDAAVEISRQTSDPVRKRSVPPRGLPALKLPEDIRSPEIPHRLGWLNYWSAAAAQAIGFPDPARDAELLSRSRRTARGGWIVPLTQDPLDLDIPVHLDTLKRAYERFPEIGGRSAP
jgi:uncharacterized protein DUF5953